MLTFLRRIIVIVYLESGSTFFLPALLLFLSVLPVPVIAGELGFTAQLVHYKNGELPPSSATAGTIMVKDTMVRMETEERTKQVIRIYRPDDGLIIEIHPHKKSYNELPYMAGAAWFSRHEVIKDALQLQGTETVSGQLCDHYAAPMNIAAVWISQSLQFPMRFMLRGEVNERHDIHMQSLDKSLFAPPEGYTVGFSYPGLKRKITPVTQTQTSRLPVTPATTKPDTDQQKPTFVPLPSLADADAKKAAFPLGIHVQPSNNGTTHSLEQSLVVALSQSIPPGFFSFTIDPDPGSWQEEWQDDLKKVTLMHDTPFKDGQLYNLTIDVIGEQPKRSSFTAKDRSPSQKITHDLNKGKIDINQAVTYQLFQAIRPSKVPEQYRLKRAPASGTPAFRRARRNLPKLNNKTRDELRPYFLSSGNPESYWYKIVRQPLSAKTSRSFTLVPAAHAGEDLLREVYITDTGFKVVIMGSTRYAALVQMAKQLVEEKKMYENFQKLMGRTTPHPGDRELVIYIVHSIESTKDREEAKNKGEEDPEPYGLCTDIAYDPNNPGSKDKSIPTGIPEIFISAGENVVINAEETRRRLGATLAHEMFHAFQCAFDRDTEPWVEEATAVWAENFIDRSWNTEQVFIKDAFNNALNSLKDLETNDDFTPYGMYLFPLFLTENRPGEDDIIRRIWEGIAGGREPVKAVKSSLRGDFEETWKKYALAAMDEDPESGKFPDNPNRWGQGPLVLNTVHNYSEFKVEPFGADLGGTLVFLDKLSASYLKAINEHEGPDAPAIRFDLTDFKKDEKVTVQVIIVYRDGRREYEDWTNRDKRVFCLNIPKQNFSEIYLAVANSAEEQKKQNEFWLNIFPESEEDCIKGSATVTMTIYGSENRDINKRYGREIEQGSSSWSETVTVRMELKPWREDIPPQLQSMLELMGSIYPEVDGNYIDEARRDVEGTVRAPVQYKDPETGSLVLKYRVTSVSITSSSGRKRLSSLNEKRDSLGLTSSCRVSYGETIQQKELDEGTKKWSKERGAKVEIFLHPDTKEIQWVRMPMVGVEGEIAQVSKHTCTKRYKDNKGFYHYKNEDLSWNDTKDSRINLTFESIGEERKGQPIDPVWKSEMRSQTSASGQGKTIRPLDRDWDGLEFSGHIKGKETTEFSWRLNLENLGKK